MKKRVYVVLNGDRMLMGIFTSLGGAEKMVADFGLKVWNETWEIEWHDLNAIERWIKDGN